MLHQRLHVTFHHFCSSSPHLLTKGELLHFKLAVHFSFVSSFYFSFPCVLLLCPSPCRFHSSPNFTSWPCSRAPSPLHTVTKASRVRCTCCGMGFLFVITNYLFSLLSLVVSLFVKLEWMPLHKQALMS